MNVWTLTIGSSDVQLKTNANWTNLSRDVRSQLDDRGFRPTDGVENRFQAPARVMGVVYSQPQAEEYFNDLAFPLIDNFIGSLQGRSIEKIILVLSDQSVFSKAERSSQHHAYWQDTCTLQPLLEKYLRQRLEEHSPDLEFQPLFLRPTSTAEGLDDWNAVLKLVQDEFSSLEFLDEATIYVSYQAGTPAISSAVQFTSLSRFGQQVKFLVSNERDSKLTRILDSSEYLKGIRKKEAEALLSSHNYSGMQVLLKDYLEGNEATKTLLKAAIQWNVAKFDEFLKGLTDYPEFASEVEERTRKENWWWIAYEEVYLAIIRKEQGNIVEAFFHSFRAFEEIFAAWGNREFGSHICDFKGIPHLNHSILDDPRGYFLNFPNKKSKKSITEIHHKLENLKAKGQNPEETIDKDDRVELDLSTLCKLFRAFRYSDYTQKCGDLKIFWDDDKQKNISNQRNNIFHQAQGMSEADLWGFWGVTSQEEWESKLLKFLNFIIKKDFSEGFKILKEASLMVKVHEELEKAIHEL